MKIESQASVHTKVLIISGAVNKGDLAELQRRIYQSISLSERVIVSCEQAVAIDESCWTLLRQAYEHAMRMKKKFMVAAGSSEVFSYLQLT